MDIQTIDSILKYSMYGFGTIIVLYTGVMGCIAPKKNKNNNDLFFTLKRINNE